MPRVWLNSRFSSWCVTLLLTLALAACHDTPRDNPFDPSLTPAVELVSAAVEDTTGSADLRWTAYAGRQPFAAYRILRQVRGLTAVDTVEVIEDVHRKAGAVRLSLYNISGQLIRTLIDGAHPAGSYAIAWDGRNDAGRSVASGVYLCRMIAGEFSAVRKLLLVR